MLGEATLVRVSVRELGGDASKSRCIESQLAAAHRRSHLGQPAKRQSKLKGSEKISSGCRRRFSHFFAVRL